MSTIAATMVGLEGRPYAAYRSIAERWFDVSVGTVAIVYVQPDPFAAPSRMRIVLPLVSTGLPAEALASRTARRAAADYFHRRLLAELDAAGDAGRALRIVSLGQEVLERTAVTIDSTGETVVQMTIALPAAGRRILGRAAATLLGEALPRVLHATFVAYDASVVRAAVATVEDQVALRAQLRAQGLVAFLADNSVLPRQSGVDDRPLLDAVPLRSPPTLAVTLIAPHAGPLRGVGIPHGVTLLVGGGYHGKSTVLAAIAAGVYDHVGGDGRERCVTTAAAVSVRAEDGRSVRGVDLRPFITHLPFGRGTEAFTTDDASGSTSQATAVIEALEAGADTLLIDEDTAAANFMVRDARMRRLVATPDEPITPFLDRVRQLSAERQVSTVLVVGGAGDYLDVADTVIQLREYTPVDVTDHARAVATALPLGAAAPRSPGPWPVARPRIPSADGLDARGRRGRPRVRARATRAIEFGADEIDVSLIAQLVESSQCHFIGDVLLACANGLVDGHRSIAMVLDQIDARAEAGGLATLVAPGFGDRALARRFEIAAALNRLRGLRLSGTS